MAELNFTRWRVESDSAVLTSGSEDQARQVFDQCRRQARLVGTVRLVNPQGFITQTALNLTGCHPAGQSRFDMAPA